MKTLLLTKISKPLCTAAIMASLAACGGGGGEGEEGGVSGGATNNTTNSTSTSNSTNSNTENQPQEFTIDRNFDLRSVGKIELVVDIDIDANEKSYLSVCHVKQGGGIDYENCVIRSKLTGGYYEGEFTNPPHVNELVAAIWFFDQNLEPIIQTVSKAELDTGSISITSSHRDI